jgi:serpin B
MKLKWKISIVLLIFFLGTVGDSNAGENVMIKKMVHDNTAFALDLYSRLKLTDGNLFFSPFSISTALAMTYAGARECTADQMAKVLHFTDKSDQLHGTMGDLISQLNAVQKESDVQLSVANAIWAQRGYQFLDEFFRIVEQSYQADLNQADFSTAAEASRQAINAWVELQTNQKIKDLMPPGVINALTRLVLVNAIYFKGFWDHPFKPRDTREMEFWLLSETAVKVPMMHQKHRFGYWENDWLQVMETIRILGKRLVAGNGDAV